MRWRSEEEIRLGDGLRTLRDYSGGAGFSNGVAVLCDGLRLEAIPGMGICSVLGILEFAYVCGVSGH